MTTQPHADIGHLTNTADPGWCVYCGAEVPPPAPPWDWPAARAAVIVAAAERARRKREERRQREARLDAAARRVEQLAAWGRIDALVTWAASATTWRDITRRIPAA